jgi:hypothetical protein
MTGGAVMSLLAGAALSIACSHPAAPSGVAPLGDLANAAAATAPGGAQERGFTPADLVARGWICVTPPAPNRILCSHPNQGFPVVGNPPPDDRPASYSLWAFDGSGNFIGPYTLLRTDLYQGQLCDGTGEPWVFRALAGYYECIHAVGR